MKAAWRQGGSRRRASSKKSEGLIDFGADYSPRFSAVYDLFGDGRTALKTSWSKYYRNYDGDIAANAYGRAGERSEMRTWLDRNLIAGTNTPTGAAATVSCPGVRVLPTDCDGVAQDNEIGTSPSSGAFANPDRPDRKPLNLQRQYNDEFTAGVQHQVTPRSRSARCSTSARSPTWRSRIGRTSRSTDYTRFETPMPDVSRDPDVAAVLKAGDMVPVYNLNPAKLGVFNVGVVDRSDTTNDTLYTGFEAIVQREAPGRRDAVRQLDDGPHAAAVVRQRRQPERPDDDRTVQPDRRHHRRGCAVRRPLLRSDGVRLPVHSRVQAGGKLHASRTASTSGAVLQSYGGQERIITWAPEAARSRTGSARRPRRSS